MFELTVEASFAAAHQLEGHPSPCGRLHGHNWVVALTVEGEELAPSGMVVDFKVLRGVLQEVVAELDHRYLNELPFFRNGTPPTAENIARYIFLRATEKLSGQPGVCIREVRVAESPSAWVIYRP